jgi:heme/copper-type cytochrome/quinol oxidase subunit 2
MVVLMKHVFTRPVVLLVLIAALSASTGAVITTALQQKPQVVEIFVERFSFTPSEFKVKAGAPVEIRLRSDDTDHGFRIVGTDVNVTIPKRGKGVATVTFVPPQPGRYVFECSKLCGAGHSFMRGTLIAE